MKKLIIGVVALLAFGVACTPEEVAVWNSLSPDQQSGVLGSVQQSQHSGGDCYGEMRKHWPAHLHGWAEKIINRESRGNAAAQNPSSSAAGCFQLIHSLHSGRYPADCRDRYNAHCNVQAAWNLYQVDPRAWRFSG